MIIAHYFVLVCGGQANYFDILRNHNSRESMETDLSNNLHDMIFIVVVHFAVPRRAAGFPALKAALCKCTIGSGAVSE
jgi:hypothetical protein